MTDELDKAPRNPLVETNPIDTLHSANAVLSYMAEARPEEGMTNTEGYFMGQEKILVMVMDAIADAAERLEREQARKLRTVAGSPNVGTH